MTALQAGFVGPADLPKVRLRLLNTGRYSRPNILFINEKVRYAFGYMGFTHTQYRQIFSLMFLKNGCWQAKRVRPEAEFLWATDRRSVGLWSVAKR